MASVCNKNLDLDNMSIDFSFGDGTTVTVAATDLPEDIVSHCTLHGISQKLGDSYSSCKGVVEDAKAKFAAALEQLKTGEWRAARGEGEAKPRVGELVEAIARIKNQTVADVAAALEGIDEETRKTLRSNERIKAVIAVIRAEKAQAKLDKLGEAASADIPLNFGKAKKAA